MERRLAVNRPLRLRKSLIALLLLVGVGMVVLLGIGAAMFLIQEPDQSVPVFDHVILIVLENREYDEIIGNQAMPFFNQMARQNTLLSDYYGISHPSLPNYIALITGDTQGIKDDCHDCYLNVPSLPEQIQTGGRTWKGYMEDLPSPCFQGGNVELYAKRHNPFVYIDKIRLDETACKQSVVDLVQLESDLAQNKLPNFGLIAPNVCNDSHDCDLSVTDGWLAAWVPKILANPAMQKNGLLVITFDEGSSKKTCCGLTTQGGRVATVLISAKARKGYEDSSAYSHYSLLKTIETGWGLPLLGHAADPGTRLILAPWIQEKRSIRGWLPW